MTIEAFIFIFTFFAHFTDFKGKRIRIPWQDFLEKMRNPIRNTDTMEEFLNLSKEEQMQKKDIGSYIAGTTENNTRKKGDIIDVTAIVLDVDDATEGTVERIKANARFYFLMHSTRKHTPEKPRYRILIPLANPIPAVKREAIARKVAQKLGILEECDPASFRNTQLMFFPSASLDGEYVFVEGENLEVLNPEEVLAEYNDWQNTKEWPHLATENKKFSKTRKKLAKSGESDFEVDDPRTRGGFIGAFCRAYNIEDAIEKFLPDVYEPGSTADRYSFIGGETKDGLLVTNSTWAYSFHATDPACERFLHAYDLVRLHLYGELDDGAKEGTWYRKLPSVKAMNKMLDQDELVKAELLKPYFDLDGISYYDEEGSFAQEDENG